MEDKNIPPLRDPGLIVLVVVSVLVAGASAIAQTAAPAAKVATKTPDIGRIAAGDRLAAENRAPPFRLERDAPRRERKSG